MKAAVIGSGGIGRAHATAYKALDVDVIGFVDTNLEAARRATAQFGGVAVTGLEQLPECDVVSVTTPPGAHYPLVKQALEHGIAVMSEKPLSMTSDEATELGNLSQALDVPLGIGFKMRHESVFKQAKTLIHEIGRVLTVSASKTQPFRPRPVGNWVPDVGAMFELSVHEYDLIHWIAGLTPQRVAAEVTVPSGWSREAGAALTVRYTDKTIGSLTTTYTPRGTFRGNDLVMQFTGEEGYLRIERPDRIIVHTADTRTVNVEPIPNQDAFTQELAAFLTAVETGQPCDPGAREGIYTTRMVEAAWESATRLDGSPSLVEPWPK